MATERQESRIQVKTTVPASQKETWREHAERLGMTLSEFVRTMVQSGRRDFEVPADGSTGGEGRSPPAERGTPGVGGVETRILDALRSEGTVDPDDLVAAVTDGIEDRVYDAIDALDEDGRVKYDPRSGGYTLTDDGE